MGVKSRGLWVVERVIDVLLARRWYICERRIVDGHRRVQFVVIAEDISTRVYRQPQRSNTSRRGGFA